MGLFHLQFLKTIFDFGSRWQLRRWYLDIDDLHATNDLFFNINFRPQRQLETLFIHMSASHSLVPNQIFLRKKHSVAKKWNWENCLHVLSLPNSGNSSTSEVARPPDLTDKKASYNGLDAVGPCMRLSLHVSNVYYKVVFTYLPWKQIVRFPMDANTIYVLESRLISRDGATQMPISEIEVSIWHNSRVCVWYFQVYKFKYLIWEKKCGFSYINLVQTVDDKRILCCVLNSPVERR